MQVLTRGGAATLFGLAGLVAPTAAHAQQSIGGRLSGILSEAWGPILFLIIVIAFVAGLWMFIRGLFKMKDISDPRAGSGAGEAILHMVAGSLLVALPHAAGVGVSTVTGIDFNLFGSQSELAEISRTLDVDTMGGGSAAGTDKIKSVIAGAGGVIEPDNCYASDDPVNCMARNIAKNAVPMGILAIFAFMFLYGIGSFATSLMDLVKTQGGQNRLVPDGWTSKFVTSILLMNGPFLFYAVSNTMLGQSVILETGLDAASSLLSYTPSSSADEFFKKYAELIGYVLQILAFFGVWAFVRGMFMLKQSAEGRQQQSAMSGVVFIVAGILLANAKVSTCMVLYTAGGSGMTMGFCGA